MPRKIGYDTPLDVVFAEAAYTDAQLEAYPIAQPFRPRLETFFSQWNGVSGEERGMIRADARADAHVDRVDADIDPLIPELHKAILIEVKDDRRNPLYQRYYGKRRPSEISKPVLGPELEEVRGWVPSLKEATQPSLKDIGNRFEPLVVEADSATSEQKDVARQWEDFWQVGNRCKLIDDFNELRRTLHSDLTKLVDTPEGKALNLPSDFAGRFFIIGRRSKSTPKVSTIASVEAKIKMAREHVAELEAQLAALQEQQRIREAAETQRLADEATLAEAERLAKELRAKLGK
jgi:hypothetical protein